MRANTGTIVCGAPAGMAASERDRRIAALRAGLGDRAIVLVGLMGAGKTVMGRRLAGELSLDFVDSDCEIEQAAGMTISEIFARHGEAHFRDRENRIVERLIGAGPRVVATGGGAFIHPDTRSTIKRLALSVWIKAELDVLMRRVRKRNNRPLLRTADPEATMQRLMAERYPVYAEADLTLESRDAPHDAVVGDLLAAIEAHLSSRTGEACARQAPEG